ncbi:MAG: hypothetical protein QOG73_1400 [Acetobacteraceae bacterium]|nr:hypothetical protein [Acetobacteraceae bacterium]
MSRDKSTTTEPTTKPTLALMFEMLNDLEDETVITGLPPTTASFVRTPRADTPLADLTRLAKVWMLIGPGASGKTVLARWLGGELHSHDKLDRTLLAALDPANRTLADFFSAVMQPPTSNPAETVSWLQNLLEFLTRHRGNAVLDFGGGDVSLAQLVAKMPTLAEAMEEQGIGLIAAYMLTPRVDDLASLVTFEQSGFRPRATALILNLAKADTPAAFDAIRRQPAYKAAIARGAVELWMPELSQGVSLRIERARVQFREARDGLAPDGRKPASISLLERVEVREFLERMAAEFQPIEGWTPWA